MLWNPIFLQKKNTREGNWVPNKIPSCSNSALILLKFETEGQEFAKNLRLREQFIRIVFCLKIWIFQNSLGFQGQYIFYLLSWMENEDDKRNS